MKPVRIRQMKRMNHNRIPGIWRLSSVPAFGDGWWENPLFQAQPNDFHNDLAEGQGFEPWVPFDTPVFKTGAFNRSATPPEGGHYTSGERGDKAVGRRRSMCQQAALEVQGVVLENQFPISEQQLIALVGVDLPGQ